MLRTAVHDRCAMRGEPVAKEILLLFSTLKGHYRLSSKWDMAKISHLSSSQMASSVTFETVAYIPFPSITRPRPHLLDRMN